MKKNYREGFNFDGKRQKFVNHVEETYKKIFEMISNLKFTNILDVGGGIGSYSSYIDCKEKYILDNSPEAVNICNKKGVKAYLTDITNEKFPFDDNTFDFILFTDVIEHLYDYDFTLKEISRVLKKNGKIILSTPNVTSLSSRIRMIIGYPPTSQSLDNSHIRFFRFCDIENELNKVGIKTIKKETNGAYFPTLNKKLKKIPGLHNINKNLGEEIIILGNKE